MSYSTNFATYFKDGRVTTKIDDACFSSIFGNFSSIKKVEIYILEKYEAFYNHSNKLTHDENQINTFIRGLKSLNNTIRVEKCDGIRVPISDKLKDKEDYKKAVENFPTRNLNESDVDLLERTRTFLKEYEIPFNTYQSYLGLRNLFDYYTGKFKYSNTKCYKVSFETNREIEGRYICTAVRYLYENPYQKIIDAYLKLNKLKQLNKESFHNKFMFAHILAKMGSTGHSFSRNAHFLTKKQLFDKFKNGRGSLDGSINDTISSNNYIKYKNKTNKIEKNYFIYKHINELIKKQDLKPELIK